MFRWCQLPAQFIIEQAFLWRQGTFVAVLQSFFFHSPPILSSTPFVHSGKPNGEEKCLCLNKLLYPLFESLSSHG